jgi:hypothetical protein
VTAEPRSGCGSGSSPKSDAFASGVIRFNIFSSEIAV